MYEASMKITQNRSITSQKRTQKKQSTNTQFGDLFTSEVESSTSPLTDKQTDKQTAPNTQALFDEATELLDQALLQLTQHNKPSENMLLAIQNVREQLSTLSNQGHTLTDAETLISVESKRLKRLNH